VAEIAQAFFVPETTMGQRITRAKTKISAAKVPYRVPDAADLPERLDGVLAVLFLVFNEGYLATGDGDPVRAELTAEAIRLGLVTFNQIPPGQEGWHRRRLELILRVPALQAHSTLRYAAWRQVIAEFVAGRTGQPPDSLLPVTLGYAVQGLFVAACEQWLAGADTDLGRLIDAAVHGMASVFGAA